MLFTLLFLVPGLPGVTTKQDILVSPSCVFVFRCVFVWGAWYVWARLFERICVLVWEEVDVHTWMCVQYACVFIVRHKKVYCLWVYCVFVVCVLVPVCVHIYSLTSSHHHHDSLLPLSFLSSPTASHIPSDAYPCRPHIYFLIFCPPPSPPLPTSYLPPPIWTSSTPFSPLHSTLFPPLTILSFLLSRPTLLLLSIFFSLSWPAFIFILFFFRLCPFPFILSYFSLCHVHFIHSPVILSIFLSFVANTFSHTGSFKSTFFHLFPLPAEPHLTPVLLYVFRHSFACHKVHHVCPPFPPSLPSQLTEKGRGLSGNWKICLVS